MQPIPILRAFFIALLCTAVLGAQRLFPNRNGTASTPSRGPTIKVEIIRAADGVSLAHLRLDEQTEGCEVAIGAISGGFRQELYCSLDVKGFGRVELVAELDAIGPRPDGSWDLWTRVKGMPSQLAVSSLGIEFEMPDRDGMQQLLVPAFSGGEFDEPAISIPQGHTVDTRVANSVQATAYYADDGSGLLLFARDPSGTKPKRFRYRSGRNLEGKPAARFALEYYQPNTHIGGRTASTPVATAVLPYSFDPRSASGWFVAAKTYRGWIEAAGSKAGGILEQGSLEHRQDVPKWMRELDLMVVEPFGWFPAKATVKDPLLSLRRLRSGLGANFVHVGLWFWSDDSNVYGRAGSWLPLRETVQQIQALRADNIRFTGYTIPSAFDITNPLLFDLNLFRHAVEDRNRRPIMVKSLQNGRQVVALKMDVAAPQLADWFQRLGTFHAAFSGVSGLYADFPVAVQCEDYWRVAGDVGVTESSYKGYIDILRKARNGARQVGQDFMMYHEAAFEWLLRVATGGQGATGVLGRAFAGDPRSRGVPFFHAVYSGYTLFWPADELYGPLSLSLDPKAYGDLTKDNMSRLLAEGFTWGSILNSSEPDLRHGVLFFEKNVKEPLKTALAHYRKTLQNLIALRRLARPWLVYGEMLASPVLGGDEVDMTARILIGLTPSYEKFRKLAVPTTAWRAADGSVRIVAANGGRAEATVTLDLARIGLRGKWGLLDVITNKLLQPDPSGAIRVAVGGGQGRLLSPVRLP